MTEDQTDEVVDLLKRLQRIRELLASMQYRRVEPHLVSKVCRGGNDLEEKLSADHWRSLMGELETVTRAWLNARADALIQQLGVMGVDIEENPDA